MSTPMSGRDECTPPFPQSSNAVDIGLKDRCWSRKQNNQKKQVRNSNIVFGRVTNIWGKGNGTLVFDALVSGGNLIRNAIDRLVDQAWQSGISSNVDAFKVDWRTVR